jgi:streptomycin 6-kinase
MALATLNPLSDRFEELFAEYEQAVLASIATQNTALLKELLMQAEQHQILVGWQKDMNHTPIFKDWQAVPIEVINSKLAAMGEQS